MTDAPHAARDRWDARHMAADDADPAPSESLLELAPRLPAAGRALDLACGRGRNTVCLARRGLTVDAVDISSIALAKVMTLASRHDVAERVRTVEHDLVNGLAHLEHAYDVVLCLHYRQPSLWPALPGLLAPGGLLLVETLARHPSNLDVNPEFLSERDELFEAAGRLTIEFCGRVATGKRTSDRLLARRSG